MVATQNMVTDFASLPRCVEPACQRVTEEGCVDSCDISAGLTGIVTTTTAASTPSVRHFPLSRLLSWTYRFDGTPRGTEDGCVTRVLVESARNGDLVEWVVRVAAARCR